VLRTTLLTFCTIALVGQVPAPLEFEVASVRLIPGPVGFHNTTLQVTPGGFNADYAALRQITGAAYGIQRVRVEGGPAWMDSDLYKIAAKAENSANVDQIREMLRKLLADRFKLAVHRETKQLPVYTLVLGKSGSTLEEVKDDPQEARP
jgi:uncharacterized protein (TIGR03435 family)